MVLNKIYLNKPHSSLNQRDNVGYTVHPLERNMADAVPRILGTDIHCTIQYNCTISRTLPPNSFFSRVHVFRLGSCVEYLSLHALVLTQILFLNFFIKFLFFIS